MSIYALFVQVKSLRVHLKIVGNATNNRNDNTTEIFSKYENLNDMFLKKQTNVLTFYQNVNHVIELEKIKSSYELLYNLFVKTLKILREYIDFVLKKKLIYPFINSIKAFVFFVVKKTAN